MKKKLKQFLSKHNFILEMILVVRDIYLLGKNTHQSNKIKKATDEELKEIDSNLYQEYLGESLDWDNLNSYTQKMQYEKLFNHDPRKAILSDKYQVREWVAQKIGDEYLIPLIGVYNSFKEINFKLLPNSFVIKTNHGSGDVVIVKDKNNLRLDEKLNLWRKIYFSMKQDYSCVSLEMHYSKIKPKIIVEAYLDSKSKELQDYKFLCFNGEPYYCWVDIDRFSNHKRNIYDLDWNLQSWNQRDYGNSKEEVPQPPNFERMIEIARILSQGFGHVRVDLYNIEGHIYFGEMTFTNGSGFEPIVPKSANYELGKLWDLKTVSE